MTTIRHGEPCGLRIKIRSADRPGNLAVFLCHSAAKCLPRTQGGGCGMAKTSNAAKPLSSICLNRLCLCTVNRSETLTTRKRRERRERPPQKQGGHAAFRSGTLWHTSTRPHGVAHVLIYPCGKACKNPPFPSRFIVADRSSPSRVRFAASRPGRLRADPKDALLTRGKGGSRFSRGGRGWVPRPAPFGGVVPQLIHPLSPPYQWRG